MKTYLLGLIATIFIAILNVINGNAAVGFSPIHCWILVAISTAACGVGVYNEWMRDKILEAIVESGALDEFEDSVKGISSKVAEKFKEDYDNESEE